MNQDNLDIQRALGDISLIRQVLDQSDRELLETKLVGITLDANLLIQGIAFVAATALLLLEFFSGNSMTETLLSTRQSAELQLFGVGFIGAVLCGLLITLYFVLWRAARNNGEELAAYIARNFKYVKNLSFISDLLMKFTMISLLLMAGKAEWVAPVLSAFIGDYLLQGRFFTLPTKLSIGLGLVCLASAVGQFYSGTTLLSLPLALFAVVSICSLIRLAARHKQQSLLAA